MEGNIKKPMNSYLVPLAIIIGFGLVAGAIFMTGDNNSTVLSVSTEKNTPSASQVDSGSTDAVRSVTKEDHILGNPNAAVLIVEYSDMECPFCKRFHETMKQVMKNFGESGEVAWVFRHFPLDQLHPKNARVVAVTSECAAEQGGNDMFWKFTDRWFELTLTNDRTDLTTVLPQIYSELGIDTNAIDACVASGKYDQHVVDDYNNAIETGGRGTPWSIVIAPNRKTFSLNGAQPLSSVNQLIEIAKQEK